MKAAIKKLKAFNKKQLSWAEEEPAMVEYVPSSPYYCQNSSLYDIWHFYVLWSLLINTRSIVSFAHAVSLVVTQHAPDPLLSG